MITFARSSSGTALRRVGYGDELVTDFSTYADTAAMKAAGWSSATSTGTGDISLVAGAMQLDSDTPSNRARGSFAISTSVGRNYVVEYLATGRANKNHNFKVGSVENGSQNFQALDVPAGTHAETFVATSTTTYVTWGGFAAAGDETQIANISVKELFLDRATDDLVLFNHPDDIPRIEYAADGSLKGLLIEEQRTNLITYSEDFTHSSWENVASLTPNIATAPDGTATATRLDADYLEIRPSVTSGTTYTYSIFIKSNGNTAPYIIATGTSFPNTRADFDLSNSSVTSSTAEGAAISPVGAGWYRISITETATATDSTSRLRLYGASAFIYGAQFEVGSFPTSYIPTSGGQKTRDPDIASIPVSAFGYNQTAGTVVVEFSKMYPDAAYSRFHAGFGADASNYIGVGYGASHLNYVRPLTGEVPISGVSAPPPGEFSTAAIGFDASGATSAVDGQSNSKTATAAAPALSQSDTLYLGTSPFNPAVIASGHIKSLKYYPRRLTDAQLQTLTS